MTVRDLSRCLLALWMLGAGWTASAGPWEAAMPSGLTARIVQDVARTRDGYVLQLSYADGTPDRRFGEQGSLVFRLGPDNEGPASLRADAAAGLWIAGGSVGGGDRVQAVLMRFDPLGAPVASFGVAGRAEMAPAGSQARALDLMPLPDGGAIVVGQVLDAQGGERMGWWRVDARGTVDSRFGLGGLWADELPGATSVETLQAAADGSMALVLRRQAATGEVLEAWVLPPGAHAPVRQSTVVAHAEARLERQGDRWGWRGVIPMPEGAAAAAAPKASSTPGEALPAGLPVADPRKPEPDPATDVSALPDESGAGAAGWALLVAIAALGGWAYARWRRRSSHGSHPRGG